MTSFVSRAAQVARAVSQRGGARYLANEVPASLLPKLAAKVTLPGALADRIVRAERRAHARHWHQPTGTCAHASRLKADGLRDINPDWRLTAVERALNDTHSTGRTGFTAADFRFDDANYTAELLNTVSTRSHRGTEAFERARDEDRRRLAAETGLDILYRDRIRDLIREKRTTTEYWYSPIDFGRGITTGGSWSTAAGTGRWEFLNGPIVGPLVAGKRVLELGTNNGVGAIMMLKAGASSVSAIEYDAGYADTARLVQRMFSWADITNYELDLKQGDMRAILNANLPPFDVVTAFCSLYYLSADEIAAMVRRAAGMVDLMIVQSNDIKHGGKQTERGRLASTDFTVKVLRENGFPDIETHRPAGYSRALMIARK